MEAASFVPQKKLVPLVQLFDHIGCIRYEPTEREGISRECAETQKSSDHLDFFIHILYMIDKLSKKFWQEMRMRMSRS